MILARNIKFTRPDDFFAEMLKTDAHMEKVREKLLEEAQGMKNSEAAKKQRQAKKFGKAVQQQKVIERQASKSDELEKIKMARKKHSSNDKGDEFGIEVEQADKTDRKRKRTDGSGEHRRADKPTTREHKDQKYGFGGAKRNIKSNDRKSTDNLDKFSVKKMKSGSKLSKKKPASRPGKDKRSSSRNKQ
jgi:rRNA-processing protein EBP2